MKKSLITVALAAAVVAGCAKAVPEEKESAWARLADNPCLCQKVHIRAIVTNEVVAVEDIGKRYVVQTHHYFPEATDQERNHFRIEVAVNYGCQYLREGEPTDTSISNKTCFCGGPWEFVTNGYVRCERITSRTGMNCLECNGYVWETNTYTRAASDD